MDKTKLEELKNQILRLQDAVEALKNTGIRPSVLYLLIQRAAGMSGGRERPVPIEFIKRVLEYGIPTLEQYVFGEDE